MKRSSLAALTAGLFVALATAPALAGSGATFTGTVAGGTQVATGMPTEYSSHSYDTGGAGSCSATITLSYDALLGDNGAGMGFEPVFFTPGRDYVNHFYLYVADGAGNDISGTEWIEDNDWEQGSTTGVEGVLPQMSHTATVTGACGAWTLTVDAHRGAGSYTISVA